MNQYHEAQDYQSIGQASPELDAVAQQHQGWAPTVSQPTAHDTPEPLADELTDASDFSFWDRRANTQLLGLDPAGRSLSPTGPGRQIANMAGYMEPPIAAATVTPTADTRNTTMSDPISGDGAINRLPDEEKR